ncbi:hypothetical protein EI94DRAFT_1699746 [Lactarius quietus]|nr:hypothetical protein EI94DRAFT_1699746 [Lactarius quietus]
MKLINGRIVATPPFSGLHQFKQGQQFKQWTGDDLKVLRKVHILAIAEYMDPQVVKCLSAFLNFCYLIQCSKFGLLDFTAIEKALNTFHKTHVFCTSCICKKGFNLPHQHSMVHYMHLIQEFGAPNGLLHGMLPDDQTTNSNPKPVRNNEEDNSAIEGQTMGEVVLAIHPYLALLAEHLNSPNLLQLIHQFLFDQLQPDKVSEDKQPWESLPNIQSPFSVFHSAHVVFYAPSDVSGSHGMHHQIIHSTPSWHQKHA